jgi:hypothetical protein
VEPIPSSGLGHPQRVALHLLPGKGHAGSSGVPCVDAGHLTGRGTQPTPSVGDGEGPPGCHSGLCRQSRSHLCLPCPIPLCSHPQLVRKENIFFNKKPMIAVYGALQCFVKAIVVTTTQVQWEVE